MNAPTPASGSFSRHGKELQRIPVIRHTMADLARAEATVIAAFKALHGEHHEPGAVHVREAALKLLADESKETR